MAQFQEHLQKSNKSVHICEKHLRKECSKKENCELNHFRLPYLWMVEVQVNQWHPLVQESQHLEHSFSNPQNIGESIQLQDFLIGGKQVGPCVMLCQFEQMLAKIESFPKQENLGIFQLRRISTPSYGSRYLSQEQKGEKEAYLYNLYDTQWRWYWQNREKWCLFGETKLDPEQAVLEMKHLSEQEVYRFELNAEDDTKTLLISLHERAALCIENKHKCLLRRRPLFISEEDIKKGGSLPKPERKVPSYVQTMPENWYPIDTSTDYELIPLNPESFQYHLVASEFKRTAPNGRELCDIFRIQNPYLWHRYQLKKQYMVEKLTEEGSKEVQLFHGTTNHAIVQAILRQNFDWRVSGKNATAFGKGCYFAKDSSLSDKYTGGDHQLHTRWMFLALVLAGRSKRGNKHMVRPPPRDVDKPYGELYDSCVDDEMVPRIYVIFDSDQCYPEYLLSYRHNLPNS